MKVPVSIPPPAMMLLYLIDLAGVAVFAVSGALAASRKLTRPRVTSPPYESAAG